MKASAKLTVRTAAACWLAAICLLLPGCWDEVNLQNVSYITAIGVDYNDGQFTLYAQMLTFSAIAKTENPQMPQDPIWIGKGQGDSVLLAYYNLGRASYTELSLDQLKTIVIHERAMNHIGEVLDGLNRQRASRYTSNMYGTMLPLEKVFTTDFFFNLSPLTSPLYSPELHEEQYTFATTQTMQTITQQIRDPGMSVLLPDLSATESYWRHAKKKINTQLISGIHVFKELKYQGYAAQKDVLGIRWLCESFQNVFLKAEKDGSNATVAITRSKGKSRAELEGQDTNFTLTVKLWGHIVELKGEMSKQEIVSSVEQKVKEEMEATFRYGVQRKMDLFQLEHALYRHHPGYWKTNAADGKLRLRPDALTVKVKLILTDSGKFELRSGT